jgi:hypothetical protein
VRSLLAWLADVVLGPRCPVGCGERVFPKDEATHVDVEHAGDQP